MRPIRLPGWPSLRSSPSRLPRPCALRRWSRNTPSRCGALADNPAVQEAFRRIEALDPWGMERLLELTQIPSPPFGEAARATRYAELLREAGADSVWTDEEGNVVALRKGRRGRRTVALDGHLDTVFPEGTDVTVRQVGDTLFAPGIGDDTRGLVVVLTTLRAMEEAGLETDDDVLFVGTVGEEGLGDLRGMKYLFREGADPIDAWIEVDGGGLGGITSMGLGSHRYRVTFKGPGGHSWGAFGLANPAHALGRGIRYFEDAADTLTRKGPRTSYNVGVLGGGTSVNSIPFEAWAEVDMRSESPRSLETIDAALHAAMERALADENAIRRRGRGPHAGHGHDRRPALRRDGPVGAARAARHRDHAALRRRGGPGALVHELQHPDLAGRARGDDRARGRGRAEPLARGVVDQPRRPPGHPAGVASPGLRSGPGADRAVTGGRADSPPSRSAVGPLIPPSAR